MTKTIVPLSHPRFLSFLAAQFLGAFNDNAFKLVVSLASLSLILDPAKQQSYLAITSALAILPFVLFSGFAGYFADRYAKSNVLRVSKAAEILAMLAALIVFATGQSITHLLVTLFLLATHSAFFSPSKYSILPEIMSARDLPKANGYLNMLTFLAIIAGSMSGAVLWGKFQHAPEIIGIILTGIAVVGTLLCLFVPQSPAGNPAKKFSLNPFREIAYGMKHIFSSRILTACTLGSAVFWLLGGLIYLSLILLGKTQLGLSEAASGSLFAMLACGIAVGSVIAGYIVGASVRLTVSIWGATILGIGCLLAGFYATSYLSAALLMGMIGMGAGLFIVPVMTLLQKQAPELLHGQILATSGFMDMVGVLTASGLFWLLGAQLHLNPSMMILAAGVISLSGLLLALYAAPKLLHDVIESAIYFIARRIYRVRLTGTGLEDGKFPQPAGPTVFVANHVTYLDGLFLSALSRKRIHYLVLSSFWKNPFTRFFLNAMGAIPFGTGNPEETARGIEAAQAVLANGGYVCIFPEGILTRTGHLQTFKRGVERILEGTDAQVIPIHLERLWGSIFSFSGHRFIKKLPKSIPYDVTVAVGKPLPPTTAAWQMQTIVSALGTDARTLRYQDHDTLGHRLITTCKHHPRAACMSDTTGKRLNRRQTLIAARLISQWLRPCAGDAQRIAIMLPASVGGVLANIAVAFLGRTSVNLNFSLGNDLLQQAQDKLGITTVITTRKLLQKLDLAPTSSMVFIEDAVASASRLRRVWTFLQTLLLPRVFLCRRYLSGDQQTEKTATILFSSGSSASPKAIMLSHRNLLSNIDSVDSLLAHAESVEQAPFTMAGVLPFFHSFGLTTCLWLPILTGRAVAYHGNPLEAKTVDRLIAQEQSSLLITTPTFARHYTAVAKEGALTSVRFVILGGEKLTEATAAMLKEALPNAHILQGYGATELGPVVAINVPDIDHGGLHHRGFAEGSVGKPIPGVSVMVVDVETSTALPPTQEGLILIKSPSCMQGYAGDAALTESVLRDGWYITGDIGYLDKHGFLYVTDRLSRFSKIGGEMVPHGKIESAVETIISETSAAVIITIEDPNRGEKLCLFHTDATTTPQTIAACLKQQGLPNLWIPSAECIFFIEEIPSLPSGKCDLRTCRQWAEQRVVKQS